MKARTLAGLQTVLYPPYMQCLIASKHSINCMLNKGREEERRWRGKEGERDKEIPHCIMQCRKRIRGQRGLMSTIYNTEVTVINLYVLNSINMETWKR